MVVVVVAAATTILVVAAVTVGRNNIRILSLLLLLLRHGSNTIVSSSWTAILFTKGVVGLALGIATGSIFALFFFHTERMSDDRSHQRDVGSRRSIGVVRMIMRRCIVMIWLFLVIMLRWKIRSKPVTSCALMMAVRDGMMMVLITIRRGTTRWWRLSIMLLLLVVIWHRPRTIPRRVSLMTGRIVRWSHGCTTSTTTTT
jgi:hypothetical protein